mgnify:CR=1 FL=1
MGDGEGKDEHAQCKDLNEAAESGVERARSVSREDGEAFNAWGLCEHSNGHRPFVELCSHSRFPFSVFRVPLVFFFSLKCLERS